MEVISNEDLYRLFLDLNEQAKSLLSEPEKAIEMLAKAEGALQDNAVLRDAEQGIPELLAFAKSCVHGEYKEAADSSVIAVLSAFLYFTERDDAIHDSIPVIGYLDDLTIFGFAREAAKEDLAGYTESRTWN